VLGGKASGRGRGIDTVPTMSPDTGKVAFKYGYLRKEKKGASERGPCKSEKVVRRRRREGIVSPQRGRFFANLKIKKKGEGDPSFGERFQTTVN